VIDPWTRSIREKPFAQILPAGAGGGLSDIPLWQEEADFDADWADTEVMSIDEAYTQPTPAPGPAVGGVSHDIDVRGLALETAGASGPGAGLIGGIIAGATAGAIALGGAGWYARRRWLR
jgi:hypothetical protein